MCKTLIVEIFKNTIVVVHCIFCDINKPQDNMFAKKLAGNVAAVMGNSNRGAKTRVYTEAEKIYNYYGVIRRDAATDCSIYFL